MRRLPMKNEKIPTQKRRDSFVSRRGYRYFPPE